MGEADFDSTHQWMHIESEWLQDQAAFEDEWLTQIREQCLFCSCEVNSQQACGLSGHVE